MIARQNLLVKQMDNEISLMPVSHTSLLNEALNEADFWLIETHKTVPAIYRDRAADCGPHVRTSKNSRKRTSERSYPPGFAT